MNWYKSKVDWWLAPLLALPPLSAVVVIVSAIMSGAWDAALIGAGVGVFVAAIYGGLVFPIRYGLSPEQLVVRFGLCRQRIDLAKIIEVYPTHNPLSSPALSLDRLYIRYGPSFFHAVMISPADREAFLSELATLAHLSRNGERLNRS